MGGGVEIRSRSGRDQAVIPASASASGGGGGGCSSSAASSSSRRMAVTAAASSDGPMSSQASCGVGGGEGLVLVRCGGW